MGTRPSDTRPRGPPVGDDGGVSDAEQLLLGAPARGAGVGDAALEEAILDLLHRFPAGLRRADLRRELSGAWSGRLAPEDLAVLDTRIGHALRRLKTAGELLHHEKRQLYAPRPVGQDGGVRDLDAPPVGDLTGLDDAEQAPLF